MLLCIMHAVRMRMLIAREGDLSQIGNGNLYTVCSSNLSRLGVPVARREDPVG